MCSNRATLWTLNLCPTFTLPGERDEGACSLSFVPPQNHAVPNQRPPDTPKNQMWTEVLGITLVEGQDLPQYGQGDIYVRFRLGDQKYKSKVGPVVGLLSSRFCPPLSVFLLLRADSFCTPFLHPLSGGCISLPAGVCQ